MCTKCRDHKTYSEFVRNRNVKDGYSCWCKGCHRSWYLDNRDQQLENGRKKHLRRYGLTPEDYERILASQGGVCAICRSSESKGRGTSFHVDHDHLCCPGEMESCGNCIRGLLCQSCNTTLGKFKDAPEIFRRAAEYLESRSL